MKLLTSDMHAKSLLTKIIDAVKQKIEEDNGGRDE